LKVSTNVKIAMQCFEHFGGESAPNTPPGCAPDVWYHFISVWRL